MATPDQVGKLALMFAVFVVIGMLGFSVVSDAVGQSTGVQTETNETVTAQYNQSVSLAGYNIDSSTVTVYGLNDSSGDYEVATEGPDYSIDPGGGSIEANSSSTLIQDGEEIKASYEYQATDELTTFLVGFLPLMMALLIFVYIAEPITRIL